MFRIKICGVTTPDDARAAVDAGADAIGLNFFEQSPRFLPSATAAQVAQAIPHGVARVGVFVEPDVQAASALAETLSLDFIQVHGAVTERQLAAWGPSRVIVAVPFSERRVASIRAMLQAWRDAGVLPAALLLDADRDGLHGGTGTTIDWPLAAAFVRETSELPIVMAGGLRPENARAAIEAVRPYAVDVASGVESGPGRKDHSKIQSFVSECASLRL